MTFSDFIASFSVFAFAVGTLFLMGMTTRRRKVDRQLYAERTKYIAHELVEKGYLFSEATPEAIHKLEAVLEDLDQEWHWQHKLEAVRPIEKLASYLGNTDFRSARV